MEDIHDFKNIENNYLIQDDVETIVHQEEPIISLHSLSGISSPQTLKLQGYIKHRKVIILVDSGSTHNFIHRRVAEETHCYVHPISNF